MPDVAISVCSEPGCNAMVRGTRCHQHMESNRWLKRKPWQRTRKLYLIYNPLCHDCTTAGRTRAAVDVHHMQPRSTHPHLALEWGNLMGLCKACHSKRTADERRGGVSV